MRVDETCACGASISVEAETLSRTSSMVESWRFGHRHVEPEPTVLEAVAEPFDFAAAIRDEVAEQLRAERAERADRAEAPEKEPDGPTERGMDGEKGETVEPRCERKVSDSIMCVLDEGHTEAHRFFLPGRKGSVAWPAECLCTLWSSTRYGTISPMGGYHISACPMAIS